MAEIMFPHFSVHLVADIIFWWGGFWNTLYFLSPPREYFNSPRYNKFLDIVSYYGALNIRSLIMKIYGAQPSAAPAIPEKIDTPEKE